jgi:hypothetical protein
MCLQSNLTYCLEKIEGKKYIYPVFLIIRTLVVLCMYVSIYLSI